MKPSFGFRDMRMLAALGAMLSLDEESRGRRMSRVHWGPPLLPRWMRRSGRSGPFNREHEAERRRRQIACGMLKVEG